MAVSSESETDAGVRLVEVVDDMSSEVGGLWGVEKWLEWLCEETEGIGSSLWKSMKLRWSSPYK
jgi:hypothetical protein